MSEQFQPLVSIIIPVYNGALYVREAIDSALAQTYQNVEVLVINDGSCDDNKTEEIALSYGDKIRYFHKENGGVSTALNLGIREMKGEYFSWLSHDDAYEPEKVARQVELLSHFQGEKVLALCDTGRMDKDSKRYGVGMVEKKLKERALISSTEALTYLFRSGTLNGCSLLIPKTAFDECGTFDESLRYNQDGYMWMKIFMRGYTLVYSAEKDAYMRVHSGQLTQRGIEIYHRDCEAMSEYLVPELIKISDKKHNLLYEYALHNAKYNTPAVWKKCVREGKGLIGFFQKIGLWFTALYGGIRPFIRAVYLKVFRKI